MAKKDKPSNTDLVTEYIRQLNSPLQEIVETIRQIILNTDSEVSEQIKWNAPSFLYTGEMKPFNPKEYKRDIAVFNLRKGVAMLVFPTGAAIDDSTGLLEGNYSDGRRLVTFENLADVHTKKDALQTVIKLWLMSVEK